MTSAVEFLYVSSDALLWPQFSLCRAGNSKRKGQTRCTEERYSVCSGAYCYCTYQHYLDQITMNQESQFGEAFEAILHTYFFIVYYKYYSINLFENNPQNKELCVLSIAFSSWWCSHPQGKAQTSPCEERYNCSASVGAALHVTGRVQHVIWLQHECHSSLWM